MGNQSTIPIFSVASVKIYVTGQNEIQVDFFQLRLILNFLCLEALGQELRDKENWEST